MNMTFSRQLELYLQRRFGSAGDKRMMAEQSGIDYDYFVAILAGSRNPPSEEKIIEMGKRLKLTDEEVGLLLALSLKANAFAARFLMPTAQVKLLLQQGATVYDIARIFGVSFQAANYRIAGLK
jgi:predicted transcriptional regulator